MKKFWCAFLCVILCVAIVAPGFAASTVGNMSDHSVDDQKALDYALYFMSNSQLGR